MRRLAMMMLVLLPLGAAAQKDDFGLDFSLEAEKKLYKSVSLGFEGELRTRDNTKTVDRWAAGLSLDYKVYKWLKLSAGYIFLYDHNEKTTYYDDTDDAVLDGDADAGDPKKYSIYWAPRHRFNVSLTMDRKIIGDFRFSIRERWQYTWRPEHTVDERWSYLDQAYDGKPKTYSGKGKHVLRTRLQVEYDRKGLAVTPYANVEFFNSMSLEKTRFHLGIDWKLSKLHSVGAFYRYQTVRTTDDDYDDPNIHMIGLSYKLKF